MYVFFSLVFIKFLVFEAAIYVNKDVYIGSDVSARTNGRTDATDHAATITANAGGNNHESRPAVDVLNIPAA